MSKKKKKADRHKVLSQEDGQNGWKPFLPEAPLISTASPWHKEPGQRLGVTVEALQSCDFLPWFTFHTILNWEPQQQLAAALSPATPSLCWAVIRHLVPPSQALAVVDITGEFTCVVSRCHAMFLSVLFSSQLKHPLTVFPSPPSHDIPPFDEALFRQSLSAPQRVPSTPTLPHHHHTCTRGTGGCQSSGVLTAWLSDYSREDVVKSIGGREHWSATTIHRLLASCFTEGNGRPIFPCNKSSWGYQPSSGWGLV